MLFNSFEFLLFFPIIIIGFYTIPHKYRWLWLLLGSYYFYMAHEFELVILLFISTAVDYFCGLKMPTASKKAKKAYLLLSIFVNLGILFSFKYLSFFTSSIQGLLGFFGIIISNTENLGSYNFNQILIPVGISFYTFQTLSYTIDIYRGKIEPEKHFGVFALYVSFFPQLVAGPIERASRLIPQLKKKVDINLSNIKEGLIMMAWGFFLKVVVADRLGIYADAAFENPESTHALSLILGFIFFSFQIYYDFSAYVSIAIGAAKTLGVNLMANFNRPVFSTSAAQFWQRWHISLANWLRDYLYSPLTRKLKISRLAAVFIVFFVNGLWHGANWTFIIWSLLNVIILIAEIGTNKVRGKIIKKLNIPKKIVSFLGCFIVIGYLFHTLIFFRSPSVTHALTYIEHMYKFGSLHINIIGNYFEVFLSILLIFIVQTIHYYKGNAKVYELVVNRPKYLRYSMYLVYILIIVLFAVNRQNSFIYFQF